MKKRILITGGSGLLGMQLSHRLQAQGYEVLHLSRKPNKNSPFTTYFWDLKAQKIEPQALNQVHALIHLAGANIAEGRWTPQRKEEIIYSRVAAMDLIWRRFEALGQGLPVLLGASAVGFYGDRQDETLDENSTKGQGFLAEVCQKWEAAYAPWLDTQTRSVVLRIGLVLAKEGGALPKMLPSYRFGLAPYFGDGQQFYPWIHIDDLCNLFIEALENPDYQGVYNATAPNPVRNRDFAKELGKALGKKALALPAPRFALSAILGEMSQVVLDSARALPQAAIKQGFRFQYPELGPALQDLCK